MFKSLKTGLTKLVKSIKTTDLTEKDINKIFDDVERLLVRNEVPLKIAREIKRIIKKNLQGEEKTRFRSAKSSIVLSIRETLTEIFTKEGKVNLVLETEKAKEEKRPLIVLFLGINGTGKTTTIAKCGRLLQKNGLTAVFAASDTFRAGSIQQLEKHGENLGIRVIKQDYGADAAAIAYDAVNHAMAKKIDAVFIDTAGRMQNNVNLMNELKKIKQVVHPDYSIFVADALAGSDIFSQANEFNEKIGIDSSIINKIDADAKGGAALTCAYATNKAISYLGIGQGYDDIEEFVTEKIVDQILPSN